MTSLYGITADIIELEHMLERLEEEGELYIGASDDMVQFLVCLLYTSPSPRDRQRSRMPSSA